MRASPSGDLLFPRAAVIFPHDEADHERLSDYYHDRRRFIVGMLLAAGLLEHFNFRALFAMQLEHQPAVFWLWSVPYNLAIDGSMLTLMFVRSRRWNIALLALLILLISVPYWEAGTTRHAIARHYGYA